MRRKSNSTIAVVASPTGTDTFSSPANECRVSTTRKHPAKKGAANTLFSHPASKTPSVMRGLARPPGGERSTRHQVMVHTERNGTNQWSSEQTARHYANCVECGCVDSIHRAAGGLCADCYAELREGER